MKNLNYLKVAEKTIRQIQKGAFLVVKSGNKMNVMTIGWATIGYLWRRPAMMILVRNSRHTFKIIEKTDNFAVSVPLKDMARAIEFCGTKSGRDFNKFKECHLKTRKAQTIATPILDIPGIHIECRIVYRSAMNPKFLIKEYNYLYPKKDFHTLYFGEILACYQK
ncbi:MAG: flavin reductase [Candidatus Omnitrophota bacterium]|nr:flavin reductase [Candidatus Omnitrophota bacterium]